MHKGTATQIREPRIALRQDAFWAWVKDQNISRDEAARRIGVNRATAYRVTEQKADPSPKFIAGLVIAAGMKGEGFDHFFEIKAA